MSDCVVLDVAKLGFPWQTSDPFLFCVYHDDLFPPGDKDLGPAIPQHLLWRGRNRGADFGGKWNMYHGEKVPGFPRHPHRGFETVTVVRHGLIDHADGLGNGGRFGYGDTQWMTAGKGITHSEMFPLLKQDAENRLELFQIWLNLPAASKMAEPHFKMLWSEQLLHHLVSDSEGRKTVVTTIAGKLEPATAEGEQPSPPPNSYAANADSDVAIWTIEMEPSARWTMPPAASAHTTRTLYFFGGDTVTVGRRQFKGHAALTLRPTEPCEIIAGDSSAVELLLLQGRPIGEPVVQHGPFVMNTKQEIMQAFADYQRTEFEGPGGWPFETNGSEDHAKVWPADKGRFALYADGHEEVPGASQGGGGAAASR